MFMAIVRFDQWLIAKCQSCSDWLTKTIGLTEANYKIANMCAALCLACILLSSFLASSLFGGLVNALVGIVLGFYLFKIYFLELSKDDNADVRKDTGRFIVLRIMVWIGFAFCLLFDLMSFVAAGSQDEDFWRRISFDTGLAFEVAFVYFVSCSRLPPTTSKVAQWLMKCFMKLVPIGAKR